MERARERKRLCVRTCLHAHTSSDTCINALCACVHICMYIYVGVCASSLSIHTAIHNIQQTQGESAACIHIYICFYLFIYMHTYIYTFTTAKTEFFPHTEFELKCHSGCRRHRCTGNAIVYECSSTGAHALELCRV